LHPTKHRCDKPATNGGINWAFATDARNLQTLPPVVTFAVGKIRRGGFILVTRKGDHSPRHVHVYRDGKLVLKWNLDARLPMMGNPRPAF
jgi:hypothetical protein